MSYFLWKEGKNDDAPIFLNVYDTKSNCLQEMNRFQRADKNFKYFMRSDRSEEVTCQPTSKTRQTYISQLLLQKMAALVTAIVG